MIKNDTRRLIAQLAIPRNVANVENELRRDPGSQTWDQQETAFQLKKAEDEGLVVRIKESHRDPAKIAAHAPKGAYDWHEESKEIYASRLTSPLHQWRTEGDLYLLSQDGLDALKAPIDDEPRPMTPSEVQAAIDAEYARIHKGPIKDDTRLANALLEDEFAAWAKAVAKDCEARWNVKPKLPISGGAGWTDVVENRILQWENQKTAMPALVDPWYMCLVILALTDTDTPTTARDGSHIPTYTGYAEKSVAGSDMSTASAGSANNSSAIIFAACTAGSSTILGGGNKETNSTTGDLRKYFTVTSTLVSTTQTPAQFATTTYVTTAD